MTQKSTLLVCLLLFLASAPCFTRCQEDQNVVVKLPELGHIKGRSLTTLGMGGQEPKTFYNFRNIPFAQSVSGEFRFSQPRKLDAILGTESNPYDATKSGPLCPQLGLQPDLIDHYMPMNMEEALKELLAEQIGIWSGLIDIETIISLLEALLEIPLYGESVSDVIRELLDVDVSVSEDCLHLAVSTPNLEASLPVMVFVYGGGFKAGTQLKMGYERLGDVNDVVLVALNYRLGSLGFMCLETDEAGGNMGLLDVVLGLEWVQNNIAYFGGDPSRVTIFGESAGAAAVTHLMLSHLGNGLFHQVIAQSGSAVAPWAFEDIKGHAYHAQRVAQKVNCDTGDTSSMVKCLKSVSISELSKAVETYSLENTAEGGLGFGGINPCGQTHGERKVYSVDQNPLEILVSGNYTARPILAGSNKNEGTLIVQNYFDGLLKPNGLIYDSYFLKYKMIDSVMESTKMNLGYAVTHVLQNEFFWDWEMGDFRKMTRGLTDFGGMLLLKAPVYKMVEENSKFAPSYAFSFEQISKKSMYNIFSIGSLDKPHFASVEASHADELLYIFNVNLPVVLCDLQTFLVGLSSAWLKCVLQVGISEATQCVTKPDGEFKTNYGECIFGTLTEEEAQTSLAMVKAWTNFAYFGSPTPPANKEDQKEVFLESWSHENPSYIKFAASKATIEKNFRNTYSTKR